MMKKPGHVLILFSPIYPSVYFLIILTKQSIIIFLAPKIDL